MANKLNIIREKYFVIINKKNFIKEITKIGSQLAINIKSMDLMCSQRHLILLLNAFKLIKIKVQILIYIIKVEIKQLYSVKKE
jgi:hypothetical protein